MYINKTRGSSRRIIGVSKRILQEGRAPYIINGTVGFVDDTEHLVSSNTPHWRDKVPPVQGYCHHRKISTHCAYPSYTRESTYYGKRTYGFQVMSVDPIMYGSQEMPVPGHSLIFDAIADAKSQGIGTYDGLQLKSTYQSLTSCVFNLKRFLLKEVPGEEGLSLLQRLGERWLEYRYSLAPTFSGIDSAVKTLIDYEVGGQVIFKGKAKKSWNASKDVFTNEWNSTYKWHVKAFQGQKAVVYFRSKSSKGFAFNPAAALWDKVPWSFAVNWFVDVEKALLNLSPTWGMSYVAGSIGTKVTKESSLTEIISTFKDTQSDSITFDIGHVTFKTETFSRTVFQEQPTYNLALEFCNPIRWRRCLDVLAFINRK